MYDRGSRWMSYEWLKGIFLLKTHSCGRIILQREEVFVVVYYGTKSSSRVINVNRN